MSKLTVDDIERTSEYLQFVHDLKQFHISKGTTLQAEPVLGGKKVDLYKLFQKVQEAGGFDQVTKNRTWKQIGDAFNFPPTCTNSAYILKGLYIRNLIGWEDEKIWGKEWIPPAELLGPDAHKASTLAGKSFKKTRGRARQQYPVVNHHHHHHIHYHPPQQQQQQQQQQKRSIQPHQPNSIIYPLPHPENCMSVHDQPFTPDIFAELTSQFVPPSDRDIVSEPHQCSISELHHQNQPSYHVHSKEDAPVHTSFDSNTKQRILAALQYGTHSQIEWALKNMVTISFECPEELRLDRNPSLLDLLLKIAEVSLQQSDEAECMMEHTLQILHILRNFSFIEENARLLANSTQLKQMMIKNLVLSSSHYTHCIDVLENVATYIDIGPSDNYILCLASLVYANERHVLLGSMRVLTLLSLNKNNQTALIPGSAQTADRILQLLVVNDEEVIGAALEYLYQYTRISNSFRLQILTAHSGADIGILVSLLMAKSKFFKPQLIKEEDENQEENGSVSSSRHGSVHSDSVHSPGGDLLLSASSSPSMPFATHGDVPCVPNLASYQELDEPYRCLGWLKDKFELADPSSVLSLDDMYLLYEIRFGHERALKVKDFYTVLKIAFPRSSASPAEGSNGQESLNTGPVLEGTYVRGIKIKISILQDGADVLCQWTDCSQTFQDEILLQRHILQDHMESSDDICMWTDCEQAEPFNDKLDIAAHLRKHFGDDQQQTSSAEMVPTLASLSLSSTQQPQSSSPQSTISPIDTSPIRGISLVAAHLLRQLSKDPKSHIYFMPYERELLLIAQQRPKLTPFIQPMFSNFRLLS
ncbi:uncharacterized protein BX664DRAFT_330754 [Halteromyces radiatus]|uniref:uncharacterized protein n=1 Tax=Halteromyces radiatus TaxID=101107 RepID=UPI0022206651|nr:uncharacterized protein BX664DRAFT_330754 [Halteromyces radiatus]KAI8093857.1 hypothetical protein BX664DRAFT_330754 [Halteromyces radiatus]